MDHRLYRAKDFRCHLCQKSRQKRKEIYNCLIPWCLQPFLTLLPLGRENSLLPPPSFPTEDACTRAHTHTLLKVVVLVIQFQSNLWKTDFCTEFLFFLSLLTSFRQYLCVSAEFCTESVPMQTNEGEVSEESSSKVSELLKMQTLWVEIKNRQWISRVGVLF